MHKLILIAVLIICPHILCAQADEQRRLDSMKAVIQQRYVELAIKFNSRNLDSILSMRAKDFRSFGPTGELQDFPMGVDNTKYFLANNVPPYLIHYTVYGIQVSPNNLVAVVEVLQESVRKRQLGGKLRDLKVIVRQTETWVNHEGVWLAQSVSNIRGRERYVDGKRVSDDPNAPYDPDAPAFVPPLERKQTASELDSVFGLSKLSAKEVGRARQLQRELDKMVQAFLNNDMIAVAAFYADDAGLVSGQTEITGREQINNYWSSLKDKGVSWNLTTKSIVFSGDLVFHDGTSVLTTSSKGVHTVSRSRFLLVWKKQKDGRWRIWKEHYSFF